MPQLVHVAEPLLTAYLPAMQSAHASTLVAAVATEALPAAQLLHIAAPAVACLPLGHAVHTPPVVGLAVFPAGQAEHVEPEVRKPLGHCAIMSFRTVMESDVAPL